MKQINRDENLSYIKKTSRRMLIGYLERVKRIELSQSAWKAEVLPLNYTRIFLGLATSYSRTCVLPSALRSLTSVFGMGTGVPSLPLSLDLLSDFINLTKLDIFCLLLLVRQLSHHSGKVQ